MQIIEKIKQIDLVYGKKILGGLALMTFFTFVIAKSIDKRSEKVEEISIGTYNGEVLIYRTKTVDSIQQDSIVLKFINPSLYSISVWKYGFRSPDKLMREIVVDNRTNKNDFTLPIVVKDGVDIIRIVTPLSDDIKTENLIVNPYKSRGGEKWN